MTPPLQKLDDYLLGEQVRTLYANAPPVLPVNAMMGAGLVYITAPTAGWTRALTWYALLVTASLARVGLWAVWRRSPTRLSQAAWWKRAFIVGAGLTGLAWGSGSLLLVVPGAFVEQVAVAATVVCLASGVTGSSVGSAAAVMTTVLTSLPPYVLMMALEGGRAQLAFAIMLAAFLGTVLLVRTNNRMFDELVRLRHEVVQQRDAAEQANRAKTTFLAAASHDLRQPLHAMTLLASALGGRLKDDDDERTLESLQDSVGAMRKLLNALLDISRLDAGTVEPQVRDASLAAIARRLETEVRPMALAKGLSWSASGPPVAVKTDPVLLETILRNLLTNAVRYTSRGGVTLRWTEERSVVRIAIEDSGVGIPPEQQAEVFREFHQLHNTERDAEKGLGLGLAIVDRLVRLLSLELSLVSEVGKGTTFTLTVPAGSAATLVDEEVVPDVSIEGLAVLVIDDLPLGRESMRALLERWRCEVRLASSEEEALELVDGGFMPQVLIADFRLREERTGAQAVVAVRQRLGSEVPAVLVTGDTAPARLVDARSSGLALLHKPVPPARLLAHLRAVRRGR